MEFELWKLAVLCVLIGFSAFVESIAGGGGIISIPAYLALGIPPHYAMGSSKLSSIFGSGVSVARYIRHGTVCWKAAVPAAVACGAGSFLGAKLALWLPEKTLMGVMMVVLPIAAVVMLVKKRADTSQRTEVPFTGTVFLKCVLIGFFLGGYEGMVGPGTGTFLILAFSAVAGYDILTSSGTAKVVNYAATFIAGITLLTNGKVLFYYAIPATVCNMLGSYIGSGLAIKNGDKVIRPVMICVVIALFGKMAYDFFAG